MIKKSHLINYIKKNKYIFAIVGILLVWFYFLVPKTLFKVPYSTLILDKNHKLIGAHIADDGQWRFPVSDSIPYKFEQCLIQFEDAYFYKHPGINPFSLTKALYQNIKAKKIVRGGSTITMQLARIARGNKKRNIYQKLIEILWAMRLEIKYSKKNILNQYVSHAPFGGNVIGLEAASWRYFGRSPEKLSWSESALLAVLPNAPSLIYPGKNHTILKKKRDKLLDKLYHNNIIDSITCNLSKEEKLPEKPKRIPQLAKHLLNRIIKDGYKGKRLLTTIDKNIQNQIQEIVKRHFNYLTGNHINNIGVLVIKTTSGEVISYIGNIESDKNIPGKQVDLIMANRSTGSTLKPFLYAMALKDGIILPKMLIKDIPTQIKGYHPENFNHTYDGAVPADNALARSLNIPAVRLLQKYGLEKFLDKLKHTGISTINKPANHYGLTLILGGAEVNLWELTGTYASMGRILKHYNSSGKYYKSDYLLPTYITRKNKKQKQSQSNMFGADGIWFVFDALSKKDRPVEGDDWNTYKSAQKIAWKTGTSFGHRDAWCIGVTPQYTVGVWVGNATGEGRPGLTGTKVAAPILFDIYKLLPNLNWFEKPESTIKKSKICKKSGYLANPNCNDIEIQEIPLNGNRTNTCPYCKLIHLNKNKDKQVNSSCYNVNEIQTISWFQLPPTQAYYYKKKHPNYKIPPTWDKNCKNIEQKSISIIYPKNDNRIFLPKDFNKKQQKLVLEATHTNPKAFIYWHLNEKYIGKTKGNHKMKIFMKPGVYHLLLIDETGNHTQIKFEIVK